MNTETSVDEEYLLNQLLKSVSRAFFLSMYVLPAGCRRPISLAYLLARTADTIADASEISSGEKRTALAKLLSHLEAEHNLEEAASISQIVVASEKECRLLKCFPDCLRQFWATESRDQESIREVVNILVQGMLEDLDHFPGDSLRSLPDAAALDRHTYFAAGCVGKFWTEILIRHVSSLGHWRSEQMESLGINFGKALQLTNILRDIREDYLNHRCYLPKDALEACGLDPHQLGDASSWPAVEPLFREWCALAVSHYGDAMNYCLALPRWELRLRLSVLWPIVIGLATLAKVSSSNPLQPPRVKVSRNFIYQMMLKSLPIACSNRWTRHWINIWRDAARQAPVIGR